MANRQPLTSIRSNSIPAGGVASLQAVAPEQIPAEIAQLLQSMTPIMQQFRENSAPMTVKLGSMTFENPGDDDSIRITSVGLGWRIRSHHSVTFNFSNSAASAVTVNLSGHFPFNLLANTNIQINGGTSTYSASGPSGLVVYGRNRRGFFAPQNNGLSQALCRITVGAGLTLTQSSLFSFSGYSSVSVAASTENAQMTIDFYTFEKVAYNEDTLLGALPLQNNSVYAQLTRTLASSFIGSQPNIPMYVTGGVPSTLTVTLANYEVEQYYDFWSVPNNAQLYAPMVNNSYQVQEQKNMTVNATGSEAMTYDFPQNQFLVAAHILGRDGNNNPLAWNALPLARIVYNGSSIIPVVMDADTTRSEQYADYGADIFAIPGYRLWDGDATTDSITMSDEAGWVDTYNAATPQMVNDVATTVVTPITYSVTREVVIAGAVQTIGG